MSPDDLKRAAADWIDENTPRLSAFNQDITRYAEPAWREYRSAARFVSFLEEEGFSVEAGSAGMPTAFKAEWGSGHPVMACYAEYDAVPGFTQQAVPYPCPRSDVHPSAPGHPDPHSAQGTTGLAAVLAARHVMEGEGITGTLRLYGEPAEKMCGAKAFHAAKGYYDDLDAALAYHPEFGNSVQRDIQCGPYSSCVFTFACDDVAPRLDAAYNIADEPQIAVRSGGAIDALCLMQTLVKFAKEQMYPRVGGWAMNEAVLSAGMATADNLAPNIAQIQYAWRSSTLEIQQMLFAPLVECARNAARATACRASLRWVSKTRPGLANSTLTDAVMANLRSVGPPVFPEEARAFARLIQHDMGIPESDDPFLASTQTIQDPDEHEDGWRRVMAPWQEYFTWDDYTEYTWHAPTARLFTGKPVLAAAPSWSHWSGYALNQIPAAIDPTWIVGGKVLSATLIDLLTSPDLLRRATEEFEERTGGGRGGSRWLAPLLPANAQPPHDLRWPEYVTTARGEEWCIPKALDDGEPL
jgi:aminobenzoyl-glutamate utilization protein B